MRRKISVILMNMPTGILTATVFLAILWLTLARSPFGSVSVPVIPGLDKVVHACMFGGQMLVAELDYAIWRRKRHNLRGGAALVGWHEATVMALAVIAFGGIIELLQGSMGLGRGADWTDWMADAAGVGFAVITSPVAVAWLLGINGRD